MPDGTIIDFSNATVRPVVDGKVVDDKVSAFLEEIKDAVPYLPKPVGYQILLGLYVPPEKTKGGIFLTDKVRDESKWQGKVALVLAIGDQAYASDNMRVFPRPWCEVGDWVQFASYDQQGSKFQIGRYWFALVTDDTIRATVPDPEAII